MVADGRLMSSLCGDTPATARSPLTARPRFRTRPARAAPVPPGGTDHNPEASRRASRIVDATPDLLDVSVILDGSPERGAAPCILECQAPHRFAGLHAPQRFLLKAASWDTLLSVQVLNHPAVRAFVAGPPDANLCEDGALLAVHRRRGPPPADPPEPHPSITALLTALTTHAVKTALKEGNRASDGERTATGARASPIPPAASPRAGCCGWSFPGRPPAAAAATPDSDATHTATTSSDDAYCHVCFLPPRGTIPGLLDRPTLMLHAESAAAALKARAFTGESRKTSSPFEAAEESRASSAEASRASSAEASRASLPSPTQRPRTGLSSPFSTTAPSLASLSRAARSVIFSLVAGISRDHDPQGRAIPAFGKDSGTFIPSNQPYLYLHPNLALATLSDSYVVPAGTILDKDNAHRYHRTRKPMLEFTAMAQASHVDTDDILDEACWFLCGDPFKTEPAPASQ